MKVQLHVLYNSGWKDITLDTDKLQDAQDKIGTKISKLQDEIEKLKTQYNELLRWWIDIEAAGF